MFPRVKVFLVIFISISVMVSLNGLHLTVRYALDKSYDGRSNFTPVHLNSAGERAFQVLCMLGFLQRVSRMVWNFFLFLYSIELLLFLS